MSPRWAATMPIDRALAAGPLRLDGDLDVHIDEAQSKLWLRGTHKLSEQKDVERHLRALPAVTRYQVLEDGLLLEAGHRVPKGRLPRGPWQPLSELLELDLQSAAFAGVVTEKRPLKLERSPDERAAELLLTSFQELYDWGLSAPLLRLTPLRFALNADGQALVRGQPLPPLPGQRFVLDDAIAWPAGYRLTPQLDEATLQLIFGLAPGDIALVLSDEAYERLSQSCFVALSRGALRATAARGQEPSHE